MKGKKFLGQFLVTDIYDDRVWVEHYATGSRTMISRVEDSDSRVEEKIETLSPGDEVDLVLESLNKMCTKWKIDNIRKK